ncbi:uncharacterized protein N7482_001685 [Penicillium canariense]|uniref:Zn(2)-C6 fungal-type domain-containing protein n=1 Tax=Penicillium canariense TaxID=189055 RepID=A0A9W9IDU9_9EURO|nr:uncharacterized protein N7482_001685 [Penicillium canariense]KAJ5175808.1 hypothetical protein N7482_001685 [Penicillium canariense]
MDPSDDERPKRTARACDSCYKRKIKCDAAAPQCNWCSHHNLPCTFERAIQRKRKTEDHRNRQKASRLSERISRIEQLLAENLVQKPGPTPPDLSQIIIGNSTPSSPRSTVSRNLPPPSSSVGVHFAGRELGVVSLLTGVPFFLPEGQDWIQARTGQTISRDTLSPVHVPWGKERGEGSKNILIDLTSQDLFDLPDWRIVQVYFVAYKNSTLMQRLFPVIDVDLFEETIRAAYEQPHSSSGQISARACVIAFLAFVSRLPPVRAQVENAVSFASVDHEALASKVQLLVAQIMQEPATLDGLQAVTMLTLHELTSGNLRAIDYFGSIAGRQLFMLGANVTYDRTTPVSERSQKRQKQLRNLFWICYTLDKDKALRTGQPPVISDDNCDLTLPEGYTDRAYTDPEKDGNSSTEPVFPFDLRLSMIKSRAHTHLYSVSALKKSDADLLKSIRELDDELEEWRLSIPLQWRPTMSFSQEASDPNMSMHSVMLRLNYYLCMSIIHQASSRCKAWMQGSGMMDGVSSSLALSVEASRSTLCYLGAAEHVLVREIFWTLLFYPMSALLNIFCSILQNPLDPRSRDDLDILKMATAMIGRIFSRQSRENEFENFELVADFVAELKRLAECAIDKAWREQSAVSQIPQ